MSDELKKAWDIIEQLPSPLKPTMSQPTREEAVQNYNDILDEYERVVDERNSLHDAYLAQGEELDQCNADLRYYKSVAENQSGLKLKLEAENQALKAQIRGIT